MSDWIKNENCIRCEGEGFIKFVSHSTEEYFETETEQCPECERSHESKEA